MNILLVDDDKVDRKTIGNQLSKNPNVNVICQADCAESGLTLASQDTYDVILIDCTMPKISGIEMVTELRKRPTSSNTAVVMMSLSHDESLAIQCLDAGAQDFLLKDEINAERLKRCLLQAQKRFELEKKLQTSMLAKERFSHVCLMRLEPHYMEF